MWDIKAGSTSGSLVYVFYDSAFSLLLPSFHDNFSSSVVSIYYLKNMELGTPKEGAQAEKLLFPFSSPLQSGLTDVAWWGQPGEIRGD